jgi:DNA-binding NtrC family response regulator
MNSHRKPIEFVGTGVVSHLPNDAELGVNWGLDHPRVVIGELALRDIGHSHFDQSNHPRLVGSKDSNSARVQLAAGLLDMIGQSPQMSRVFEQIQIVAPTRCTVLITGESGTGKELVARAVHHLSPRKPGPFATLNCAAIPKELAESELFGHFAGAFTGAARRRKGRIMAADGGTLFIDEIGEMDPVVQSKLLRVLECRSVTPVGADDEQATDVRVVAATHRDLRQLVRQGSFREDLFYRLNVIHVELPPLRERLDDLAALVRSFLRRLNDEHGRVVCDVSAEAMEALRRHNWPGNIRELYNTLESAVILSRSSVIDLKDLPAAICDTAQGCMPAEFHEQQTLFELEGQAIQQCLARTQGNRKMTSNLLGISTRTLANKMRRHGMERAVRPHAELATFGDP